MFLFLSHSMSMFTMNTKTTTKWNAMVLKGYYNSHVPSKPGNCKPDDLTKITLCVTKNKIKIKELNNDYTLKITQKPTKTTKSSLFVYLNKELIKHLSKNFSTNSLMINSFNYLQKKYTKRLKKNKKHIKNTKNITLLILCRNSNPQ